MAELSPEQKKASEDKREKIALAKLTPGAITVKIDSEEVRVATTPEENTLMNAILVSQGRAFIQRELKKYREIESTLLPKEIKDLIASMKDIIDASETVHRSPLAIGNEKPATKQAESSSLDMTHLQEPAKNDDPGVQASP